MGEVLNGGYVMSVAGRVLSEALPHSDPLTVTGYFLAPAVLGTVECEVTPLKSGRKTSFASLTMYQDGEAKLQVTGAFGDIDGLRGEDWSSGTRPEMPPFEECSVTQRDKIELRQRAEIRVVEGAELFSDRVTTGTGRLTGWTRHTDGANADALSLLMFADAFPPPVFTVFGLKHWVPTLELTVQVRARPAPGPLQVALTSRHLTRGVLEEDGELWDSDGTLVAVSRQTARFRL